MIYAVPHYLNGKNCYQESECLHDIYNPAHGEVIGQLSFADLHIVNEAVNSAKEAWPEWAATPLNKKVKILFKFRSLLEKYQADLANKITMENGKTIADAYGSINRANEIVEYHCGLISQLQGIFSANAATNIDCLTLRQPLGVCLGVSPFNFPVMVPMWMMIPAIFCGNCFILKPSEQDPSASLQLFELLTDAGLPSGVANCVQGDKNTVKHLLEHKDIVAVTAVASTPVAASIYQTAIMNGKRAHTFGGAKNHALVMPDADFTYSADAIAGAAFGSAGERCMAISVVVTVGEGTAEKLLQELLPRIQGIRIDIGSNESCDMGPVISKIHRERILTAINQGITEGANLLIDGRDFVHPLYHSGFFIGPSLFDNVKEDMAIYQNEIFGPVLLVVRANSFADGLNLINRHQYGNGTAIFTRDGFYARSFSEQVRAGMVGINIPIPVPIVNHPFGGWKHSVFGDTNMHGLESINFYTKRKTITSKWPSIKEKQNYFVMPSNS